jgi:hypothetical protein
VSARFTKPDYPIAQVAVDAGFAKNPAVSGLVLSTKDPGDSPTLCRDDFENAGILRPYYLVTGLRHSEKEVRIFGARQRKRVVKSRHAFEQVSSDQNIVAGARVSHSAGCRDPRCKKSSVFHPVSDVWSKSGRNRA